jgi:hypothetical protein
MHGFMGVMMVQGDVVHVVMHIYIFTSATCSTPGSVCVRVCWCQICIAAGMCA